MCGRFTLRTNPHEFATLFGLNSVPDLPPRYNIAPTQDVLCIRDSGAFDASARQAALLRWGLVPGWADDPKIGNKLINARSETVAAKPSFRSAFKRRRCLIVADGFYEWQRLAAGKQPWFFRLADDEPFAFAGLWETWSHGDGPPLETCCLLTTDANTVVGAVHDRMPVILPPADHGRWLDPATDAKRLHALLRPYPADAMTALAVSPQVNSPRHEGPELLAPAV